MIALWAKASATMSKVRKRLKAAQRLLKGLDANEGGFVNLPVLMEFFWVLRSRYKLPQTRLAAVMRDLIGVEHIEFEALEVVGKALATYEAGIADFADMIIALRNRELGAACTSTFDEGAAKSISGMELLA
jgi:predicted nucleic-acid-binding protein